MARTRFRHDGPWRPAGAERGPVLPSIEAVYLSDPEAVADAVPPPLEPAPEPRVHVRVTDIDLELPGGGRYREGVGYVAVDVLFEGRPGEYPLLMPIDLEAAVAISRERFGEPKKLAEVELNRQGDHVEGKMTRHGVTFAEVVGEVTGQLAVPEPAAATQYWFKFLPAVSGRGFDAGPFLVAVDQVRTPVSLEEVDGKVLLRDCPSAPVADLPVEELVSVVWTTKSSSHQPRLIGPVDPDAFAPFAAARYDHV